MSDKKSLAGKLEAMNKLIEMGLVKTPKEIFKMLEIEPEKQPEEPKKNFNSFRPDSWIYKGIKKNV